MIGAHTVSFSSTHIGITTGSNFSNQRIPADFDYFWLRSYE